MAYTGPVVKLRHAPGPAGSRGKAKTTALGYVNFRREEAGLPAIAADRGLDAASSAHARYLALNHVGTHDEVEGRPEVRSRFELSLTFTTMDSARHSSTVVAESEH